MRSTVCAARYPSRRRSTAKALASAFETSRIDYCNSVFSGVAATHLHPLQSVLNAAARLIVRKRKYTTRLQQPSAMCCIGCRFSRESNTSFVTLSAKVRITLLRYISNRIVSLCQHTKVVLIFAQRHLEPRV